MDKVSLIIAGGGNGERFRKALGNHRPELKAASKIFVSLAGRPVWAHALKAFQKVPAIREVILAVPAAALSETRAALKTEGFSRVKAVAGGATRAASVLNALKRCSSVCSGVLVHDGARPLISPEAIIKLLREAKGYDGAVLASPIHATVKQVNLKTSRIEKTLDRRVLFAAETPQFAKRGFLLKAYRAVSGALEATDEASLVEAAGGRVRVVTHDGWNPKITTYQDFELAEAYLNAGNKMETRTGLGRDLHRLVEGRKLLLGGIHIPYEKGCLGHSDGDALLHAVTDALLGAAGMGDIGEWYSDRDPQFKNIASSKMLSVVLKEVLKKGWVPVHADTVITLEKPRLLKYKPLMRQNLAKLLGLPEDAVSIKAKTQEGLGPEGEGLAVTAEALVTMTRSCQSTGRGAR